MLRRQCALCGAQAGGGESVEYVSSLDVMMVNPGESSECGARPRVLSPYTAVDSSRVPLLAKNHVRTAVGQDEASNSVYLADGTTRHVPE